MTGTVYELDGIRYKFTKQDLRVHSLEEVHAAVSAVIQSCWKNWQWEPVGLRIQTHSSRSTMGMAFDPGSGNHLISLSKTLLKEYDIAGVARVVAHELCHHFREEKWPRLPLIKKAVGYHDKHFCRALSQIDPLIDENNCTYFDQTTTVEELPSGKLLFKILKTVAYPVYKPDNGPEKEIPFKPEDLQKYLDKMPIQGSPRDFKMYLHPKSKIGFERTPFKSQAFTNKKPQFILLADFVSVLDKIYPTMGWGAMYL